MQHNLSMAESIQHAVILQVIEGKISKEEAWERLGIHRTTLERKIARLQEKGPLGLAHQSRGKSSNFAADPKIKESILALFDKEYRPYGFRVAHFYQDASERFPKPVSYPTVVRWLKTAGLTKKTHKGWRHHSRRPRREAFGEMLQMDTSIHDWLDWKKNIALVSAIDDATSFICGAYISEADTTRGNMTVLRNVMESYGLFASLYVDRSPIFKVTRTGGFGRINQPTFKANYITQVERALDELGIELIYAYSPQAKGRVERSYATIQSRLIPELRKNGIREIDKANLYLKEKFIPNLNERFAQNPANYRSFFVPLLNVDLNFILAEKHHLTISNDHIVSSKIAGLKLKILPSKSRLSYAKCKVDVFKHTNGQISVLYQGKPLNFIHYPS